MTPDEPTLRDRLADLTNTFDGSITFSMAPYDCGTAVTATVPGKGSVRISIDCGEDEAQAVDMLRARMVERGMIAGPKRKFTLTYPSGRVVVIWALDEGQAIKLASQGQPEKVEVVDATA